MNPTSISGRVDCHVHVFDPARFAYAPGVWYEPTAAETGTAAQLAHVLDAHDVQHALLVGPNSGYGRDNRCLLDAIAHSHGRFKGIAVVANDASRDELQALKAAGVIGIAFNVAFLGIDFYKNSGPLLGRLRELDMIANVQVEGPQLRTLAPLLADSGARLLFDHCGRPLPGEGVGQPGFADLLELAETGRAAVKLSGFAKASAHVFPHDDMRPFVDALIETYTPDALMWASDWPFLRAPARIDYGPLLRQIGDLLPDDAARNAVLVDTPRRWLGFAF